MGAGMCVGLNVLCMGKGLCRVTFWFGKVLKWGEGLGRGLGDYGSMVQSC